MLLPSTQNKSIQFTAQHNKMAVKEARPQQKAAASAKPKRSLVKKVSFYHSHEEVYFFKDEAPIKVKKKPPLIQKKAKHFDIYDDTVDWSENLKHCLKLFAFTMATCALCHKVFLSKFPPK